MLNHKSDIRRQEHVPFHVTNEEVTQVINYCRNAIRAYYAFTHPSAQSKAAAPVKGEGWIPCHFAMTCRSQLQRGRSRVSSQHCAGCEVAPYARGAEACK